MSKNKKNKGKGKKRLAKVFLGVFLFFAVLFSALALWLGIFYFIKADKTDYVPENYSLHLRTDSVWKSVNPMVDLQAADVLLSDPSFSKYKPLLVDFRQSDLRNSKLFKVVLSRRADFMLYEDASFVAMVDSGFLSGIVRLAPAILKHLSIENLSVCHSYGRTWFEYVKGERTFYVQIIKNLIIISSDKTLFDYSVSGGHSEKIPDKHKKTFEGKLNSAFSITADSRKVLNIFAENNSYVKAVLNFIPEDEPSVIDFGITDSKLKVCVNFPYDITEMDLENPVGKRLKKNSKIPDIVQRFPSIVQYYTVLSAGSLSELKDAAFYAVDSKVGLEEKWQTAESLSNFVFNKSIEEL